MADFEYGVAVGAGEPVRGKDMVAIVNWLGALISVALIAGLTFWGYQLMVRDVTGVPVVQALTGPMRIAPQDPGGKAAEHQGLAVNNIAAEGEAAAPAERLVLAPAPVALQPEDQTAGQIASNSAPLLDDTDVSAGALATDLAVAEALTSSAEDGEAIPAQQAALIETALETSQGALAAIDPATSLADDTAPTSIPLDVIPASIAGVSRSPRPPARPATLMSSLETTTPTTITTLAPAPADTAGATVPAAALNVTSVDPDIIPVGTRLAQLGAYPSPEIAKAEWLKAATLFEAEMGDKSQVIQKAQSGGRSFYRLRVMGFADISEARHFCAALMAGNAECIPVITK